MTVRVIGVLALLTLSIPADLAAQRRHAVALRLRPISSPVATSIRARSVHAPISRMPSARGARTALGALIGVVVGGVAGYFIVSSNCDRCDESGPAWMGATVGAAAGGVLGAVIVAGR